MKTMLSLTNMLQRFFIITTVLLGSLVLNAQTFPVQVTPQLVPPYTLKLSDYTTTASEKLAVNILLTDVNEIGRRIRLKVYVEGQGLNITTQDVVLGAAPIFVDGGVNLRLTNIDLQAYFRLENLRGISSQQYNNPLPNGAYNYCFEVYDYFSGLKLSSKSCTTAFLIQNDPPVLNLPTKNNIVNATNPQNILFTWSPRHTNISNIQYEFTLKEIWDQQNPQASFLASVPFYRTTIRNTTLLVGPEAPQLLSGKIYGWQVRAFVSDGLSETSVFKNDGKSEIFWFKYIENCKAPGFVISQALTAESVRVNWQASEHLKYNIQYRKKGFGEEDWFEVNSYTNEGNIYNLEADTVYEFRVGGACTELSGYAYSNIQEFTTPTNDEAAYYNCGLMPEIDIKNQEPLPGLDINDTFTAGDFPVVTRQVTGSNGTFSGWGYITIPFLENIKELIDVIDSVSGSSGEEDEINIGKYTRIKVKFDNIQVNTSYQLTSGVVQTSYDADWGSIIDADQLIDDIVGDDGKIQGFDASNIDIDTVTVDENGNIIIHPVEGEPFKVEVSLPTVITDSQGEQWTVDEEGNITKGTAASVAEGGVPTKDNTEGISGSGTNNSVSQISSKDVEVEFLPSGKYGTDVYNKAITSNKYKKEYEFIETHDNKEYGVLYKLISDTPDIIKAKVTLANGKTKEDVVFKTLQGSKITSSWSSDTEVSLNLSKKFSFGKEEIVATVKPKDSTQKHTVAGKLNVWHAQQRNINLTLVSVDGASTAGVGKRINEIYNTAGVNFTIFEDELELGLGSLDVGDSDLISHYTEGEKRIISKYKEKGTKKEQYYMFFLNDNVTLSKDLEGFMPLKRQFGFVFNTTDAGRIAAHEIGHGIFGLKHPWDQYNDEKSEGKTDYLMDYGSGTKFSHMDWQKLHAPGIQLYLFQGDEAGESRSNDGIDLLGNIITLVDGYDENKIKITGVIDSKYPYLRYAYKVYPERSNQLSYTTYYAEIVGDEVKYFDETKKEFPYIVKTTSKGVAKVKVNVDNCRFNVGEIQWTKISFNSIVEVVNKVKEEIKNQNPDWKTYYYNKKDSSCDSAKLLADILENDASSPCNNNEFVEKSKKEIQTVFSNSSATDKEIVEVINNNCLSSLRKIEDDEIFKVFKKLAVSKSIKEEKEIAILRLMTVIDADNYVKFYDILKLEKNKIYLNLIDKVHNSSILWFDGENLSTFIDVLLYMNYNSTMVEERAYLLDLLMNYSYTNIDITSKLLSKVFNDQLKDSEYQSYFSTLKKNDYKFFKDYYNKLFDSSDIEKSSETVSKLIASKGNSNDIITLSNTIIEQMDSLDKSYREDDKNEDEKSNSLFYIKKAALISTLIQNLPSDKLSIYGTYKENDFKKFIYYSTQVKNSQVLNDSYLKFYINGFAKLIDEVGQISDKMALVNWAVKNKGVITNLDILLTEILDHISTQEDKDFVFNKLSKDKHELFKNCVEILSGSTDFLFKFSKTYSKLISEASSDEVAAVDHRIKIIKYAIKEGSRWNWFWVSADQEDMISAMFSHMSSSESKEFIRRLKEDKYELFFDIWKILESVNLWAAVDRDNKRFENFAISLGKKLIISGEVTESIFPENLVKYKNEEQKYLTNQVQAIKPIKGMYVPLTRANYYGGTGGNNNYKLEAKVSGNKIHVTINIEDKKILDEKFKPFQYVFIELLEKTKVNETLTYNKGDVLAIPAFYLAWMDGYIKTNQINKVIRVGVDIGVVVLSTYAIVASGGTLSLTALAALKAEIVFATVDGSIAIYGDELKQVFGDEFVNDLEVANMIWGLANLPSALINLPKGLATLKTIGGKIYESGTVGFKAIVKSAKDLKNAKIKLDFRKLASAIKALKETDRVKIIKKFKNHFDKIAVKYNNLIESGIPPKGDIKKYYNTALNTLSNFYYEKAGVAFAKVINTIPSQSIQKSIVNKLLHLKFEGKTFCKISPDGVISDLKIFSRVENYTKLAGEFTATIFVNGKTFTKKISVIKDYRGQPLFRAKFGAGTKHDGELINYVYARNGNLPPYANGTKNVEDIVLQPGTDKVYIVEYESQKVPGGFGSKKLITTEQQLRDELAVKVAWKNAKDGKLIVREYEVLQPIEVRSGPIGPQTEVNGVAYPGGGHQYEFMDNWYTVKSSNYLKEINKTYLTLNTGSDVLTFNRLSDDILNLTDSKINFLKSSIKYNKSDNYIDVIIHAIPDQPRKFSLIVDGVETSIESSKLAERLYGIDPNKTIRLLSCDDGASAVEISKSLARDIIHSKGEMKLYENGVIKVDKWYVASPNGAIDELNVNTVSSSGKYIKLGKSQIEKAITNNLKRITNRLNNSEIDEIILNTQIVDEALLVKNYEGKKLLNIIDELAKKNKFENPEDLFDGLDELVNRKGRVSDYLDQINEYEEGLHWLNKEEKVFISRKFGTGSSPSELDVRLDTSLAIVECKRVSGVNNPAVHDNIKKILTKYTDDSPAVISESIRKTHKKFIGQIKIVEGGGDYKNIDNAEDFVKQIKEDGLINSDITKGIPLNRLKVVHEWHIVTKKGRFVIKSNDWTKYD